MTGDVRRAYLIDEILVDGRPLVRIREVVPGGTHRARPLHDVRYAGVPGAGKKGVRRINPLRRRVVVALVVAVLGVLAALGWAVWLVLSLLFAYAVEVGVVVALVVLMLAGTGTTCTIVHIRR